MQNLQQNQLEINDTKKLNDMVTWLGGAVKHRIQCDQTSVSPGKHLSPGKYVSPGKHFSPVK
jgi:hypothetical protein